MLAYGKLVCGKCLRTNTRKMPADKYTENHLRTNTRKMPADNLRTKTVHARAENIADTDLAILNFIVIYNKVTLWIELQLLMN